MGLSKNTKYYQAIAIHKALMYFQYKNSFVSSAYQQNCDLLDSHILSEVDALSVTHPSDLSTRLGVGKSLITRRLQSLKKREFVVIKENSLDRRKSDIKIATSGQKLLTKIDSVANNLLEEHCRGLTYSQIVLLQQFINRFAENHNISSAAKRRGEKQLRAELRTLARGMGIIGREFMRSSIPASSWMILIYTSLAQFPLSIRMLAELLALSHGATSKAVIGLTKQGYIQKIPSEDGREVVLALTTRGEKQLLQIENQAATHVQTGLNGFTVSEAKQFRELIEALSFGTPESKSFSLGDGLYLHILDNESDYLSLRTSFVKFASRIERYPFSGQLFSERNLCLVVKREEGILGGAEISTNGKIGQLWNYFFSSNGLNPLAEFGVVVTILRVVKQQFGIGSIDVANFQPIFSEYLENNYLVMQLPNRLALHC